MADGPTRFFEELGQDVIIGFLLLISLIGSNLLFIKGPLFHQVRDAVAFKPSILGVFAFLVLV